MNLASAAATWKLAGVGDYDGDGADDLVWIEPDGTVEDLVDGRGNVSSMLHPGSVRTDTTFLGTGYLNQTHDPFETSNAAMTESSRRYRVTRARACRSVFTAR